MTPVSQHHAIGVFDSGVGGLTVLQALREALPDEDFLYLGDTARVPYGTKSADTVARYAVQAAEQLVARGIKALVVACNTASAAALPVLRERFPQLRIEGVIEPGASAAAAASRNGRIAVAATEGTVAGGAYQAAIARLAPRARIDAVACSLLVALAEEGWLQGKETEAVIRRYLTPLFEQPAAADTLVLGCTHFPVLRDAIRAVVGSGVRIVDSASTTAAVVAGHLADRGLHAVPGRGKAHYLVTDNPARFARVAQIFTGEILPADTVEMVDLAVPPAAARQAGTR